VVRIRGVEHLSEKLPVLAAVRFLHELFSVDEVHGAIVKYLQAKKCNGRRIGWRSMSHRRETWPKVKYSE
jgi:hypothetical protein